MRRRRTTRPRVDGETARMRRLDWSRGPSAHGARYPLKRPVHRRLVRPLIRLVPFALLILLMWIISRGFMSSREARLWQDIQIAHRSQDVSQLGKMASFLSRYPGSRHAEDVSYYFASLGHDARGCTDIEPVWRSVLESDRPDRTAEAAVRLGDCALERGDTTAALDYFRRAFELEPASAWTAEAALNAGLIAEHDDHLDDAMRYYRSLWRLPSTIHGLREASRRIGEIYFDALSVFRRQYRVRSGDVLYGIARAQGVTMSALLAANPHVRDPAQIDAGALITIPLRGFNLLVGLDDYVLYLLYGDQAIRPYPIAIGAADTPTEAGRFEISIKETGPDELTTLARAFLETLDEQIGDLWLGFGTPPHGIHGGATLGALRTPSTPGTIQLLTEDLDELARLVPLGTPLRILQSAERVNWYPTPTTP